MGYTNRNGHWDGFEWEMEMDFLLKALVFAAMRYRYRYRIYLGYRCYFQFFFCWLNSRLVSNPIVFDMFPFWGFREHLPTNDYQARSTTSSPFILLLTWVPGCLELESRVMAYSYYVIGIGNEMSSSYYLNIYVIHIGMQRYKYTGSSRLPQ